MAQGWELSTRPTDFSLGALAALKRAARLPLTPDARIAILHVVPGDLPGTLRRRVEVFAGHRLERAVRLCAELAEAAGYSRIPVKGVLARGRAFVEIVQEARRRRPELVVLGRHGQRRLRDLLIGTTAERVVRKCEAPVLLVNLEPRTAYRRPLLAIDLEAGSRQVCTVAARLIPPDLPAVYVVHAYEVPFAGWIALGERDGERSRYRRQARQQAQQDLERFLAGAEELGLPVRGRLRYGDPRLVVLEEARRRRADLVAVGTHGRAGLARALLGSVAETVIGQASCDVLVVPTPGVRFSPP
ncbi:MAG TPA: universal stress protein [Gemmatimonadales bacterium]|nr:universal stress protein [Gemmatimonadales bacterium]